MKRVPLAAARQVACEVNRSERLFNGCSGSGGRRGGPMTFCLPMLVRQLQCHPLRVGTLPAASSAHNLREIVSYTKLPPSLQFLISGSSDSIRP
jgi:hypothetical protein